jgi:uncharacterized membrane protein YvbJ
MKTCPKCQQPHEGNQTYCPQCWRRYDAARRRVNRRLDKFERLTLEQAQRIIDEFGDGQFVNRQLPQTPSES